MGLAPEDGLPVGLQVMAPARADARLYKFGATLEALLEDTWGHPILDLLPEQNDRVVPAPGAGTEPEGGTR